MSSRQNVRLDDDLSVQCDRELSSDAGEGDSQEQVTQREFSTLIPQAPPHYVAQVCN
jgi:hypothetical protein